MKFIAITECPQGQRPGEVFDATPEAGQVLVSVGSAKPYHDKADVELAPVSPRRRYARRDLDAEP